MIVIAGIKGRSGRKSHYDEMSITEVVNKSIKTVNDFLGDDNISLIKRVMVAKDFALKHMPSKVEGEGFGDKNFIQILAGMPEGDLRGIIEGLRKGVSEEKPV